MNDSHNHFKTVDEYIQTFPRDIQERLQTIRAMIREELPTAQEVISYNMPSFRVNSTYIIHVAAWKKHIAIYPIPAGNEDFKKETSPYIGSKSSLHFPHNQDLPLHLLRDVIQLRIKETLLK